ncbi:MAG: Gfo/Idh/MocA family oxidoreductase [Clostridia bacterium]|nr:Gfo/Idh/MocA family oxidoreductase [Clostridia bacterium]
MHIGILGTGFGKYHRELYKEIDPSIHLTFWGRNDEKLKKIQSELKCDYITDINEFLECRTVDFIDICLPSQLHSEYAIKALQKNQSVFIETPAVTSIEEGIEIMETAKITGKKVLVDMFIRYDPYYRMIYDYSQNQKYGALKHLTVFRRTPPFWGKMGDDTIAASLMIHDLDFVSWLGKDLKIVSYEVTTNNDNSGAVIDCLLSNPSLKVHVQGNSMLSMGSPFSIGYEATFENASISYIEKSFQESVETECFIYSEGETEKVTFELDQHCKALLVEALKDFRNEKDSGLTIENALPALSIAFGLSNSA